MITLSSTKDTDFFLQTLTAGLEEPQQHLTKHQQDQGAVSGLQQAARGSAPPYHQHQKDDSGKRLHPQVPEHRLAS